MSRWGGRYAQALLTYLIATRPHTCGRCLQPIDASLRGSASKRRPSVGHIVPRSKGGTDSETNLRLEHYDCNAAGGNRPTVRPPRVDGRFFERASRAGDPAPTFLLSPGSPEKRGIATKTSRYGRGTA